MCGRFSFLSDLEFFKYIYDTFGNTPPLDEWNDIIRRKQSFNIAPSHQPLVLRNLDGNLTLSELSWGFIPSWEKDKSRARKPINARSETAATNGMFRRAFASRRCLVPASGFYEWKRIHDTKQPYYISSAADIPLMFGGIWERHEETETFCILTTSANEMMAPIHDRMPVIIPEANWNTWLNESTDTNEVQKQVRPYPAEGMKAHPVSPYVNSPRNNDSRCTEQVAITESLFEME